MHDAQMRALGVHIGVRVVQRIQHAQRDRAAKPYGDLALAPPAGQIPKIAAADVLHGDVHAPVQTPRVIDPGDARMVK